MDTPRRLYRSDTDRMLVGVCGGLGSYLRVDPVIVRVVFVLLTLVGGSGLVVYLVLAVVVPSERRLDDPTRDTVRDNVEELGVRARELADDARSWVGSAEGTDPVEQPDDHRRADDGGRVADGPTALTDDAQGGSRPGPGTAAGTSGSTARTTVSRNRAIVGWVLVAVGAWLFLVELGLRLPAWLADVAWPLALIAVGVLLLVRRRA